MTITAALKNYVSKSGLSAVVIRVRDKEKVQEIPTGIKIRPDQWNGKVVKHPDKDLYNAKLTSLMAEAQKGIKKPTLFTDYLKIRETQYKANGQRQAAYKVKQLIDSLPNCSFEKVTAEFIRGYASGLKNSQNTVSKKIQLLRCYFQNAIDEGVYSGVNPFVTLKFKRVPVKKEKLTEGEIQKIQNVKLSGLTDLARDIFLFSYYCKGIRFENVINLKRSDIRDGRVYVHTNKGKKYISVKIHSRLKQIIDKYSGEYVFPLNRKDGRRGIDSANAVINRDLKIVAGLAGISKNLTMHIARHSIAFHLKQKGVQVSEIKDILGHSDTRTTEGYLQSLDDEALDSEMEKVYNTPD